MTTISWTDKSWNPIVAYDRETGKRGWFCVHASPGCMNCYAEAMNEWRGNGRLYREPNIEKVRLELDEQTLLKPLSWKAPSMVFPCSMTDLFLDHHPDEWIDQVIAIAGLAQCHVFQCLTKRADRAHAYFTNPDVRDRVYAFIDHYALELSNPHERRRDDLRATAPDDWPLKNIWLGVSTENQRYADERIPLLLATPAAVRWVSYEPALGPIDFSPYLSADGPSIDWGVVGGESKTKHRPRPFDVAWARSFVEQFRAAGKPPFVKQLGNVPMMLESEWRQCTPYPLLSASNRPLVPETHVPLKVHHPKGEDPAEWPEQLRVREYPEFTQ